MYRKLRKIFIWCFVG